MSFSRCSWSGQNQCSFFYWIGPRILTENSTPGSFPNISIHLTHCYFRVEKYRQLWSALIHASNAPWTLTVSPSDAIITIAIIGLLSGLSTMVRRCGFLVKRIVAFIASVGNTVLGTPILFTNIKQSEGGGKSWSWGLPTWLHGLWTGYFTVKLCAGV